MFQCIHKIQFIISCRHFGKYKVKPGKIMRFPSTQGKSGSSRKKPLVLDFIFSSLKSNRMKQKKKLTYHIITVIFTRQVASTARGSCSDQLALCPRCSASADFTTGLAPSRHVGFSAVGGFGRQNVFCNSCRSHGRSTGLLANYVL